MTQDELIKEVGKVIPNGMYSEETIQLAFHMFRHGYSHAIKNAAEWLENNLVVGEDCFENLTVMALNSSSIGDFVEQFCKSTTIDGDDLEK